MCIDMSLLLLTVTLRGVSNKHCLLPLFSFHMKSIKVAKACLINFILNDHLFIYTQYEKSIMYNLRICNKF